MTGTAPRSTSSPPSGAAVHVLQVAHLHGDAYTAEVRGHRLVVDQPTGAGGTDTAPTPVELFAASLATCVAFYAGSYLARHHRERDGLRVRAEFEMASDRPTRVRSVRLTVTPPPGLSEQSRRALLAVASHCTVHNTLRRPPEIETVLKA
ncbi:OsmC family protein [Streptomyces sp. NPDC059786]|uniref:OsmC family protein n=1 Tax=Streptomyces sp. NPDC059786 TaxID=3346946 RepID=UPI003668759C